jgi:hypothetical protein
VTETTPIEVIELHQIMLLQEKLDTHIGDYEQHKQEESDRWDHLLVATERNTAAITALSESTKGMVDAWAAANGTMKTLGSVGRFAKWVSSMAILVSIGMYMLDNHH